MIKKHNPNIHLRDEFQHLEFAGHAIQKLLDDYQFDTVLDIGCGSGQHSEIFKEYGKKVTAIDYGQSKYYKNNQLTDIDIIEDDFNYWCSYNWEKGKDLAFDCIWASHVLEHQSDLDSFFLNLRWLSFNKEKMINKKGMIVAITVPPKKDLVVSGHLSIWNAGLLLYNLVSHGIDCRNAKILEYGYNISVIFQIEDIYINSKMPKLNYDSGDLLKLKEFFPSGIQWQSVKNDIVFDGDIKELNW